METSLVRSGELCCVVVGRADEPAEVEGDAIVDALCAAIRERNVDVAFGHAVDEIKPYGDGGRALGQGRG